MDKSKTRKDLPTKSTNVKSEKSNSSKKSSDRRNEDQPVKKFAVVSPESVTIVAESIGIPASDLSEEACIGLAEDVSYKLRETIHKCCTLLYNNKRRKLLTDDVNRVFETCNTPAVYGHSVAHELDFDHIQKADLFVEKDNEVDIVAMSSIVTTFTKPADEYVKGTWLLQDPAEKADFQQVQKDVKEEPSTSKQEASTSGTQTPKPSSSTEEQQATPKPPAHFINYYLQIAKIITGSSEGHLRVALADLRTNSKIGPLVPYFLNLVALSVNKLKRNGRLTDALLRTIEALLDNPHVDPSSQLAVNRAVNAMLVVAIQPKVAVNYDDLLLRRRAAQLLAKVLVCWSIELKQQMDIVRQLLQLLLDSSISLKSHYGAVASLTALGQRILDSYFWPILDRYILVLEEQKTSPADAQDVQFVKGAIMIAVERMYRRNRNQLTGEDTKRRQKVEQKLYEFLGDALVPRYNLKTSVGSVYPGTQIVMNSETEETESQPLSDIDLRFRESMVKSHSSQAHFTFKHDVRGTMPKLHLYSVFSLSPYAFRQPKEIIFNFIGSNQISSSLLKRRKIGEFLQKEHKSNHYRFAQMWQRQKGLKKTRSIKYCSPSHKKSSVGDLFGFL